MDYTKIVGHLDGLMAYYSFTDPSIKMSQTLKEMAARREEQARLVAERKQKEQVPPGAAAHGARRHGMGISWGTRHAVDGRDPAPP
jgi:hypothetical protein